MYKNPKLKTCHNMTSFYSVMGKFVFNTHLMQLNGYYNSNVWHS